MLKQLAVRLEEEFITQVKMLAIQQGVSVQEYVRLALTAYATKAPEPKFEDVPIVPMIEKTLAESLTPPIETFGWPDEEDDPMDERYYYVIPKTHHTSEVKEDESTWITNGAVSWTIPTGGHRHIDENGYLIPFRYTTPEGHVVEPTQEQLEKIKQKYGKPVTVEK